MIFEVVVEATPEIQWRQNGRYFCGEKTGSRQLGVFSPNISSGR
jgi:hypothetical protein